jgi:hypothetical protein
VLREQPDKVATIEQIAKMLHQLAKLYQIPNWDGENAVLLAKWILGKYECEPLEVVIDCLVNPPITKDKNWRLTPDTIQEWFAIKLDEQAQKREADYQKEKQRLRELESQVPENNWPDFDKLLAGTWYEEAKNGIDTEKKYQEIKEEYLKSQKKETSALDDFCAPKEPDENFSQQRENI